MWDLIRIWFSLTSFHLNGQPFGSPQSTPFKGLHVLMCDPPTISLHRVDFDTFYHTPTFHSLNIVYFRLSLVVLKHIILIRVEGPIRHKTSLTSLPLKRSFGLLGPHNKDSKSLFSWWKTLESYIFTIKLLHYNESNIRFVC